MSARDDACPICGATIKDARAYAKHRCPKRTLAAINAADTRSWSTQAFDDPMRRPFAERLRAGFRLLADDAP